MRIRILVLSLFLLISLSGCTLLQGPPDIVLPSPIPSPPPLNLENIPTELVIDPQSDILPGADPEIMRLMNEISRQSLVGYVQQMENFQTRHTFSEVDNPTRGVGAARIWIQNELVRVGNGRLLVQTDDFAVNNNGLISNQQNIVATLPGTGAHPGVVVMMAHYDSRTIDPFDGESFAPGANDNASGVAALIETARVLSAQQWNQTILFVAFAAEEQGRDGSIHFVTDRVLNGWQFDAGINNDIIGGRPGIPQSIRLFSPGPDTSPPRQFARYVNYITGFYLPQFTVTLEDAQDREGRYSDHITFLEAGVPAVRLTESIEDPDRQHNSRDTSEFLDYEYLRQVTQLNMVVLANLAGAPPPPAAPAWAPMADPGGYILTWAPDPLADGYAISFRPIGQENYAPFRFVSGAQAGNVALTGLDPTVNYMVSIAAIDATGRMSLFSREIVVGPG